ncbi:MAG: S41 family peptidase [Bacteroidia bacterium]|nr:S41 family peptidase [Bacteroidia bacterium]
MSKTFVTLILILFFLNNSLLAQKILTPSDQLEDLTYLVERLEEIHPNPYDSLSKEDFYGKIELLKKEFSVERKSSDFAKLLMPLLSALGDAHTEMEVPQKEFRTFQEAGGSLFSFLVDIREQEVYVKDHPDYEGAKITQINGIPLTQILPAIRSYVSAEREAFREAVIEKSWQAYSWFELGEIHTISIEWKGKKIEVKNGEETLGAQKTKAYEWEIVGKKAWIRFNRMANLSAFKKFLKESFREIASKEVDTLLIDLRKNGGGDSRLGDLLISYLYEGRYRQVSALQVKASSSQKAYFHKTYIPFFLKPFLPLFKLNPVLRATFGKSGKTYEIKFKEKQAKKRKNSFRGKVYALIGPSTFSSAAILANALKEYEIAEMLGEETGGIGIFYGDNIYIELPHSGLRSTISFKKFVLPGAKADGRGVVPDRPLPFRDIN